MSRPGILFIFPVALDRLVYGAVYEAVDALAPAFGMGFYYVLFAFGHADLKYIVIFLYVFVDGFLLSL